MEISKKSDSFCVICSLQFDKKAVYDIHMSFVHKKIMSGKNEENIIEVKEEHKILTTTANPNENSVTEIAKNKQADKREHKCCVCDYIFSFKSDLKRHVNSVHGKKKPHKYFICDSQKNTLNIHIASVHEK